MFFFCYDYLLLHLSAQQVGGSYVDFIGSSENLKTLTWEEVAKHTSRHDQWLVIDGCVYDISSWQYKHPGGARIMGHFAGQDATVGTQ